MKLNCNNLIQVIVTAVFFLLFAGCNKELNYQFPYSGDKLVLYGSISPVSGFKIAVYHSFNPNDTLSIQTINNMPVTDATLSVWEEGLFLGNLHYDTIVSAYISDTSIIPEFDKKYVVKAISQGFPEAESEEIFIPTLFPCYNGNFEFIEKPDGYHRLEIEFDYTDNTTTEDYYIIGSIGWIDGLPNNILNGPLFHQDDAIFGICGQVYNIYGTIIPDNCIETEGFPIFEQSYFKENDQILTPYDSVRTYISFIEKRAYQSAKKVNFLNETPAEPYLYEGNIKNGYGYIYGINEASFLWKL